jgi:hypothetical protein
MKQANLPLPELGMIAATRAMLGAGLGLLLADKFPQTTRKQLGWTLFLVGALNTIPLGFDVFRRLHHGNNPAAQP